MAYLDFTQMYPTLVAFILMATGFFTVLVDRRGYASRGLIREAKWSKRIGTAWVVFGACLFLANWVWRNFIW